MLYATATEHPRERLGDDFKKTIVDPYYKKEFKAARKNGESGWAVINDRLRYERHAPHRGSRLP